MAGKQQLLHGDCSLPHHVEIGKRREICDGIGSGCTCGDLTECEIMIVVDVVAVVVEAVVAIVMMATMLVTKTTTIVHTNASRSRNTNPPLQPGAVLCHSSSAHTCSRS